MPTITIGNAAGKFDFSVLKLDFKSLLNDEGYKKYSYHADAQGVQTVSLFQKDGDFVTMTGAFTIAGLEAHDRLSAVVDITSFAVGSDKQVSYTIDDFDLTKKVLQSDKTIAKWVDAQTYTINGNDAANTLAGGLLNDKLYGNGGNDKLYGGNGDDKLYGGAGDDSLSGGSGKNLLQGDAGNDTYFIAGNDKIIEAKGKAGGYDTIVASQNTDLAKYGNIEALTLTGVKDLKGFGDAGNNKIVGNGGDNTLGGDRGNDVLTGGKGIDHFVFVKRDGVDTITDFDATGKDHEVLDLVGFGKLKFANLDIEKHGKDGVDIDLGHGDHIILDHVRVKDLDASDFHF